MRIVANEKYIARRATVGKYASLASIGLLLIVFALSWFRIGSQFLMMLVLAVGVAVGLLLSFVGGYYGERFAGPAAHHERVRDALKGLDKRYTLFQYTLPVPHALLGPGGLTVFVVRSQPGTVSYKDGHWRHRQRGRFFRQLAGQENLGLPEMEVERQVKQMTHYLDEHLPGADVPIRGAVLFTNPAVKLDLENPPVPVFYGKKVKSWLRKPPTGKTLPNRVRQQLEELFLGKKQTSEV